MPSRLFLAAAVLSLVTSAACGPGVDLAKTLEVTSVFTGWYDQGVVGGKNKLVPSITFQLHNKGTAVVSRVQLLVSFWKTSDDGEWDSALVTGIGSTSLAPGMSTDPLVVRATIGYTFEQPRAEIFSHSQFQDVTAKIFAKRSDKFVPLGEFKLDRRLLAHAAAGRP
jgi:hypothetical protein